MSIKFPLCEFCNMIFCLTQSKHVYEHVTNFVKAEIYFPEQFPNCLLWADVLIIFIVIFRAIDHQFEKENIRFIIFRDHDLKGRSVLFDSLKNGATTDETKVYIHKSLLESLHTCSKKKFKGFPKYTSQVSSGKNWWWLFSLVRLFFKTLKDTRCLQWPSSADPLSARITFVINNIARNNFITDPPGPIHDR